MNEILTSNETSMKYFYIFPFPGETKDIPVISTFFFLIYSVGVLVNSSIITVICLEAKLHKPMYLFICHLSIVDIFYTSVTVPKLLHMLLSGNPIVSSSQCYTQLYFFMAVATAEETLLFVMAYDRYVAICIPLHYHRILSRRNCIQITLGIWVAAFLHSSMFVTSALNMSTCHSNIIHQFYCDAKSLTKSTCATSSMFFVITGVGILIFAVIPCMCMVISYVNIFLVIFKMKSKESRKKAFSTCSSHITVVCIYYGMSLIWFLTPSYSDVLDFLINILFATITPMINPIIYSLQNSNVRAALLGLVKQTYFLRNMEELKYRHKGN